MAFVEWLTGGKMNGIACIHNSILSKKYNGNAVVAYHSSEDDKNHVSYVDCNRLGKNIDDITQYTCRFGYNNGKACMFITFTAIHPSLLDGKWLLCLEFYNCNKGTTGKCSAINVFKANGNYVEYNPLCKNITFKLMSDVKLNEEICLYLVANNYIRRQGFHRWKGDNMPSDWHVRFKCRPSFRQVDGGIYNNFIKNMVDFTDIDYLLVDELEI